MLNNIKKQIQSCLLGFLLTILLFPFQVSANNLEQLKTLILNVKNFREFTAQQYKELREAYVMQKIVLVLSIENDIKNILKNTSSQHTNTEKEQIKTTSWTEQLQQSENKELINTLLDEDALTVFMEEIEKAQSYLIKIKETF